MTEQNINISQVLTVAQTKVQQQISQATQITNDVKDDATSLDLGALTKGLIGAGLVYNQAYLGIKHTWNGIRMFKVKQAIEIINLCTSLTNKDPGFMSNFAKEIGMERMDFKTILTELSKKTGKDQHKYLMQIYGDLDKFSTALLKDTKALELIGTSNNYTDDLLKLRSAGILNTDGSVASKKLSDKFDELLKDADYLKSTSFADDLTQYKGLSDDAKAAGQELEQAQEKLKKAWENELKSPKYKKLTPNQKQWISNQINETKNFSKSGKALLAELNKMVSKLQPKEMIDTTVADALKNFDTVNKKIYNNYNNAKKAYTTATKTLEDEATKLAKNFSTKIGEKSSSLAAQAKFIEAAREIVQTEGAASLAEKYKKIFNTKELEQIMASRKSAEKILEELDEIKAKSKQSRLGKIGRGVKFVGQTAYSKAWSRFIMRTGLSVAGAWLMYDSISNVYTPEETEAALNRLCDQLDAGLPIQRTNTRSFNDDERKRIIEYLIKKIPANNGDERKALQEIRDNNYQVPLNEGMFTPLITAVDNEAYSENTRKYMQEIANSLFFDSVAKAYPDALIENVNTTDNTQNLNDTETEKGGATLGDGSPTSIPEPDPTASPDPNKKPKPEPDPTAKTDEDPDKTDEGQDKKDHSGKRDPNKPYSLDEIKNPQNMSKQDLQDYLERGKILAAKKQLGKLTPEEEQEFKALSSAFNGYNSLHGSKQTDTSGKGNGTQKAPGNPPITTPGNTPGNAPGTGKSPANDAGSSNSDSTKTLPPEALIQADQRGFWERNWDWIVAAVAAVAVAIGAVFLIRKQKKKTDKAKDEASTLQTQVTDLTNKVNELTEKKDGSTLANNSTQINTDTLDGNTGNGENTTIIVPSSKSMG